MLFAIVVHGVVYEANEEGRKKGKAKNIPDKHYSVIMIA